MSATWHNGKLYCMASPFYIQLYRYGEIILLISVKSHSGQYVQWNLFIPNTKAGPKEVRFRQVSLYYELIIICLIALFYGDFMVILSVIFSPHIMFISHQKKLGTMLLNNSLSQAMVSYIWHNIILIKRKVKQWWSIIPPISAKWTNWQSPQTIEHILKDHDIWHWKSRYWLVLFYSFAFLKMF